MEYVEMIKDHELVLGFQELISDSDPIVVKRTIKVFTTAYHHTLRLLGSGELEDDSFLASWMTVKGVVDSLIGMVKHCDNEGILIQLLRFTEAAVISHLLHDFSAYPTVFERGREVVKSGLRALKELVTTPYVGGSSYLVGVRSLISIACLRPDLWEPVTDLLKKQLSSLPPTLFDHNVRSLNKTLQRNLFRLLRRADTAELKSKLIEMMVGVGVPRKMVVPWAPLSVLEPRKRDADSIIVDRTGMSLNERVINPPEKKPRLAGNVKNQIHSDPRAAPAHGAREFQIENKDPRLLATQRHDPRKSPSEENVDPRKSPSQKQVDMGAEVSQGTSSRVQDPRKVPSSKESSKQVHMQNLDPPMNSGNQNQQFSSLNRDSELPSSLNKNSRDHTSQDLNSRKSLSESQESGRSPSHKFNISTEPSRNKDLSNEVDKNKNLAFLTSLIPSCKPNGKSNESDESVPSLQSDIKKALDLNSVCSLVVTHIKDFPIEEPKNFVESIEKYGELTSDIETMNNRMSKLLYDYLVEFNVKSLTDVDNSASLTSSSNKSRNCKINQNITESSSASSTPSSTPPPPVDTDMRQVYPRVTKLSGDVDMRIADPRLSSRDPRLARDSGSSTPSSTPPPPVDTDMRPVYPRVTKLSGDVDMRIANPRLSSRDPRLAKDPRMRQENKDPVLPIIDIKQDNNNDPRLANKDRRQDNDDRRFPNIDRRPDNNDPRIMKVDRINDNNDPRLVNTDRKKDNRDPRLANADRDLRNDPRLDVDHRFSQQPVKSIDPRLDKSQSTNKPERKSRWEPAHAKESSMNNTADSAGIPHSSSVALPSGMSSDPRVMAQSKKIGLLPIPTNMNPPNLMEMDDMRMRFQTQFSNQPKMQPQSFGPQRFPLSPTNRFNGPYVPSGPNGMIPHMLNGAGGGPFHWQNNVQNQQQINPALLVAQSLAALQSGMLSPGLMHL